MIRSRKAEADAIIALIHAAVAQGVSQAKYGESPPSEREAVLVAEKRLREVMEGKGDE